MGHGDLATIIAVVAAAIALSRKLDRIEQKVGGLGAACIELWRQLFKLGGVDSAGHARIAGGLKLTDAQAVEATLAAIERVGGNPISLAEAHRLRLYYERASHGDRFTYAEAEDFRELSERAARERPDDPGASALKILGGFAVATAVSSDREHGRLREHRR